MTRKRVLSDEEFDAFFRASLEVTDEVASQERVMRVMDVVFEEQPTTSLSRVLVWSVPCYGLLSLGLWVWSFSSERVAAKVLLMWFVGGGV
jgi:hypothetical protein